MFHDRVEAGYLLAGELMKYKEDDCIILGIPRGGSVIAKCVGEKLKKPWDIVIAKKIGAPFNNEIAIGAVAQDGQVVLNYELIKHFNISRDFIDKESERGIIKIRDIQERCRGSQTIPDVSHKKVIIVDDGIATGYTFAAAVCFIRKQNPDKIIAAAPVASAEAIDLLGKYVDEVVCLEIPQNFICVGYNYLDFEQKSDADVLNLFKQSSTKRLV